MEAISRMLIGRALQSAFEHHFPGAYEEGSDQEGAPYEEVLTWFRSGNRLELQDATADAEHLDRLRTVTGLENVVDRHASPGCDAERAALMELVLEGLHQGSLLSRDDLDQGRVYGDMLAQMAESLR